MVRADRVFLAVVVALALWHVGTPPVFAQQTGSVTGRVADETGGVLPGVGVTLRVAGTGQSLERRYSQGDTRTGFSATFFGFSNHWHSTDQIPRRAVEAGLVNRFGFIEETDGGETYRYAGRRETVRADEADQTSIGFFGETEIEWSRVVRQKFSERVPLFLVGFTSPFTRPFPVRRD